jgi:hypothetical protein
MRKFKRLMAVLLIFVLCASVFTACKKDEHKTEDSTPTTNPTANEPKNATELIEMSAEAMADANSNFHFDLLIKFDASMNNKEDGMNMAINIPAEIKLNGDIAEKYMHGDMSIAAEVKAEVEMDGQKQTESQSVSEEAEFYYVIDEESKTATVYVNKDDQWLFSEQNVEELISNIVPSEEADKIYHSAEMTKDGDGYVVSIAFADILKNANIIDTVKDNVASDEKDSLDEIDIDAIAEIFGDAKLTMTFNEDKYLTSLTTGKVAIQLKDVLPEDLVNQAAESGIDLNALDVNFELTMNMNKFGEIKANDVEVPDSVKDVAIKSEDDSSTDDPTEEPTTPPETEPTTPDDKVSDKWTDLDIMIDGVVYKFPYDYDKLQKNGWSFDLAEYDYEDGYILNKGDQTYSTIEMYNKKYGYGYDSFAIWCGFQNFSDNAQDITKCDLWSIELDMAMGFEPLNKYPDVKIAKGITFGSTEQEVIAAFGECDDIYISNEFGYKTYEYQNNYTQYMTLTISDKYGVTSIDLSSYGE